jgi:leucyl-tRNA synthetase
VDANRERHWQETWARAHLSVAQRDPGREKFYAIVAYTGPSGFLHIGHLRGLTLADALHRYWRMRGRAVFFPTGTHATGILAVAFAQKVQRGEPGTIEQLETHDVPREEWTRLEDPVYASRFLGRSYLDAYRRMGVLIDETAYVTTIDPDYSAFIGWQFRRLAAVGAIVQAPYFSAVCPVCGPVAVDASETDLSRGGGAEIVRYTTVPFVLDDGRVLLAATLRPETVYGVTNIWVHPDEPLVSWKADDGSPVRLATRAGAERLREQHGGTLGESVEPSRVIGRTARVPFTNRDVPVLASRLVDPAFGSGLVMSVPAHAPADWLALQELPEGERSRIPSIPEIIYVPPDETLSAHETALRAGPGLPAERAARATGARSLMDRPALDEATERLYRLEFAHGRMLPAVFASLPVAEARERIAVSVESVEGGFPLRAFSEPVTCRNGHEVVVRRIPDQWFLRYGDEDWKAETHRALGALRVRPDEYSRELPGVIDWFDDRPCTRRGRWLGTPFPLDPTWVIEPIADSTFYPAYFVVRRFVADGRVRTESLTDALFDYVFLGEGPGEPTVDRKILDELRAEFLYWYPLDVNIGGKEHKRVHFPAFVFTNVRLLPPELRPKGIFVHWWLVVGGEKISKKEIGRKGGAIPPLRDALERWGADALRLFYAISSSPYQDVEWDPDLADDARTRLADVERSVREISEDRGGGPPELEAWLESETHRSIRRVREAIERFELREVAQEVYVTLPSRVRRYLARGGSPGSKTRRVADSWIRLLCPLTPHLAEELGQGRFPGLASVEAFPDPSQFTWSESAVAAEEYLLQLEADLTDVLRPTLSRGEKPEAVRLFVAAPWKETVETWIRESPETDDGATVRSVMERAAAHPELTAYRGDIARYASRFGRHIRTAPTAPVRPPDELAFLRSVEGYLARRFGFARVSVHSESEAEEADPLGRRERARPGRPGFYLVTPTGASRPSGGGVRAAPDSAAR